ncbi:patatin-like phospholipase family protein [soil metagenome]
MKQTFRSFVLAVLALAVTGCGAYPLRNDAVTAPERPKYDWDALQDGELQDTLVSFTALCGGTRATALAMAVLQAMDKVKLASGRGLADEIDIISSVSGGSVTAGYFALYGKEGLPTLEENFVRKDGIGALLSAGLNPISLANLASPSRERIDLLVDYLDRQLFDKKTFAQLIERKRRPYLILNAADMVEGTPFPFTQYTMDLLCSDLTTMKLSTAVAASAAFPVALSPVTLKNYSKCAGVPTPVWIRAASNTSWYTNPGRVVWGRTASAYADGSKQYVHLLDGGIADNLGVSEPYRLLTTDDVPPLLKQDIADGRIRKIIFVMVNARSFPPSELDRSQATPGVLDMLGASISSSIDRASLGSAERLRTLLNDRFRAIADGAAQAARQAPQPGLPADVVRMQREQLAKIAANFRAITANTQFIAVDFDAIPDAACRQTFHSVKTTWTLPPDQIDALKTMGEALFAASPDYGKAMQALNAQPPAGTFPTVGQACNMLAAKSVAEVSPSAVVRRSGSP